MKNKLATRTITALILSGMLLSTVLTSCAEKAVTPEGRGRPFHITHN